MNQRTKIVLCTLLLAGLPMASMTGCVGGYVATGPGYYGGGPWFDGTVVVGGGGWYGGHDRGAYVHPDGGGRRR